MAIELKEQKDPFNIDRITKEDLSIETNNAIKKLIGNKIHKKISISSTHGVGKTTLINLLKKIYRVENTIFYPESAIYLFEHNKLSLDDFSLIEKNYIENIYKFDFIFFIESRSIKIDNNGYRSTDKQYQLDIYNIFKRVLKTIDHNRIKIIHVKENTPLTRLIRITNELKKSIL